MRVPHLTVTTLFAVIVSIAAHAQTNYDKLWRRIDSLYYSGGLSRSAIADVNKIYTLAKNEKNDLQLIKALIYKMAVEDNFSENAAEQMISILDKDLASTTSVQAKAIMRSTLAQWYWKYFQDNRWKFYDRTNTTNFKKDDINTWTIDDFHHKISELFLASLQSEATLRKTTLKPYDILINKGNARYLRPTLFDLLANEALVYFETDERDITKPAYAFEINDPAAFASAQTFAQHRFNSKDTVSLHLKALQLYQRLISFHLEDDNPAALIDIDIERITFVNRYSVMEDKDSLYKVALESITKKYPNQKETTRAWHLIAKWHADRAKKYSPFGDTTYRYEYIAAKNICERVIAQKDSSIGKANCERLLQDILKQDVQVQAEVVNVPDQPFRLMVSYRNVPRAYFRIVKVDRNLRESIGTDSYSADFWQRVSKLPAYKSFDQTLPATNDHQGHYVEIKVDALPVGDYALVASSSNNFSLGRNPMVLLYFYVSNIAYVNYGPDFFALHRETGRPLENASVQVWRSYYNYNTRKYERNVLQKLTADKNGYFKVTKHSESNQGAITVEINTPKDHLFLDNSLSIYRYPGNEDITGKQLDSVKFEADNRRTYLFLDRSIYRPGQTVYFKGITVTRDFRSLQARIVPNLKTWVYLANVEGSNVDSIQVTSNEFGSYSGKFRLRENMLNGEFRIVESKGVKEFAVEEYKRPKFYVAYEKMKGTYRVNDSVEVTGFAKAYAGNNIDGATVSYRVVRRARFPYPWLFSKMIWPPQHQEDQEIAHGQVISGVDGKFTIKFVAIPDKKIPRTNEPVFDYEITADVTDIAGETRSATEIVSVSYKALQLSVDVPGDAELVADSLKKLTIRTSNQAGEFQPAKVNVSIYRLKTPERLIRRRYWTRPDQFVMTKEEYLKYFPYDEYSNESDMESWEKQEKVYERSDSTNPSGSFNITTTLKPGVYVAEVTTTDKYGLPVKDVEYISLLDPTTGMAYANFYKWQSSGYLTKEPGEMAVLKTGSSATDVFLVQAIARQIANKSLTKEDGQNVQYNFSTLNNEQKTFSIPVTEAERGSFAVSNIFVKHNRFYDADFSISVPWTNKELDISYETFRDKTLPGSDEKWKVKISGSKNEKVAAEILTAMYDASLDQFRVQSWQKPDVWPVYNIQVNWNNQPNFRSDDGLVRYVPINGDYAEQITYDRLITSIHEFEPPKHMKLPKPALEMARAGNGDRMVMKSGISEGETFQHDMNPDMRFTVSKPEEPDASKTEEAPAVQVRKNFNETAFFFPDLKTDSTGNVEFSFTIPEALTQWKWMLMAHTKDLSMAYGEKSMVTQKELMVQPNIPRFVREGDRMDLSAKIANMGDKEVSGQIQLQLIDATTNQPVDGWFHNMFPNQYFTVAAGQSTAINFTIQVPYQFNKPLIARFVARAGNVSDGEENSIPVLSNRLLVTETLPLNIRGGGSKNFTFEKLLQSDKSETLTHHALTVEFTSNPAWYAVQAIPYLMEYPYECAEQLWNRVYANALAAKIVNASPRIKEIFRKWSTTDTAALMSNLQKNQELKSILLEETPWVLQAKNETEQRKRIALLFDMAKLSDELDKNLDKLMQLQSDNGGFVWFKGGPDDRYMTQYILTGIGHLKKLNAIPAAQQQKINAIVKSALPYLDQRMKEDYDRLVKQKADLTKQQVSYIEIHYLYMRSFFTDVNASGETAKAFNYYRKQAQQFWLKQSRYMQGLTALALFRTGDGKTATDILRSLKQNAVVNDELGMYWKDINRGYYWHQAPIETQALLIEAFTEVTKDITTVEALKTWLLKNKQTNNWSTTKATAEACYALLLQGTDWLSSEPLVQLTLGDKTVSSLEHKTEAGSGYFKHVFDAPFVNNTMGNISVNVTQPNGSAGKPVSQTSWGAVYWQYFENLDNITPAATPLKLTKKLFVERNTDRGPVLEPVEENAQLKTGDKIKVRIELRVDREMEYVHMKDMRAASLEPVNVISSYKWQGGLGYYESTKDASTNFFFSYLPKGTYVFEYPLFVTHTGTFSNGITTIQCMYAPEFSSHSEGVKINVEGN